MDLKTIIKEQEEELKKIEKKENIILREEFQKSQKYLKFPNVLAIIGIRRCGKSTFSYLLSKNKKTGYINFDDERIADFKGEELNKILEVFYELHGEIDYVVLDEIQNIENWELFVNRLRRSKKVILTGSNSKLLSGELSTHLTGRHIDITLFPFSFKEYLEKKEIKINKSFTTKEKIKITNHLKEYLKLGGFPEVYKFGRIILPRIYDDIITKDIVVRYKINKIQELKKLSKYLITNSSEEFTYGRLSKILDINHVSTVSKWIGFLEETFLMFKLERFDFKLKKQFLTPKKIYAIDTGMVNSIGFKFSENRGKIIENKVALELFREKSNSDFMELYYWKDIKHNEVDFVIKKGKKIESLIQVSYIDNKEDMREREINSLIKAGGELKCKKLFVITWDYEDEKIFNKCKIKFIPLWKWLIQR